MEQGTQKIWREFHTKLLAFIRSRVASPQDAEDILQDVFLRLHKHAERLDEVENVTAWVYRVTRNAIIDRHRAVAAASNAGERVARESKVREEVTGEPEVEQAEVDLGGCMRTLVERLPERYAEAVKLTEIEGATQKHAAEQLGLSVSGMKSRVQRGRAQLKGLLMDCCEWQLDTRGGVIDVAVKDQSACGCNTCGSKEKS